MILLASWAEETLATMSLDEKIGQLFVVPACPKRNDGHFSDLVSLMNDFHIGNVIVKQSDPVTQVKFLNRLQEKSKRPLLVMADAEWGLAMRMTNTIAFPRNMTLGAIQDLSLLVTLGEEIATQAKRVGIHLNLAPAADVNNNPLNPVIHMRSFGSDPKHVADCVSAISKGFRQGGIFACAKHFPGHGDTSIDSHRDLPVIHHSRMRLEEVELVPFARAVADEIDAVMTAHLYVPSIDDQLPTSLSKSCLDILKEVLHFKGLIISDALNMKAVADRYTPEKAAFLARLAGCDLLLYGDHIDPNVDEIIQEVVPKAFCELKKAYLTGLLNLGELDRSVLKILKLKEKIETKAEEENLIESLHSREAVQLKQMLFQEAITLLGEDVFPLSISNTAYISFGKGDSLQSEFQGTLPDQAQYVVFALHERKALTKEALSLIETYQDKAIVCLFDTPYTLEDLPEVKTILVGYENDEVAQKCALNVLLGKMKAKGKLPISYPLQEQMQVF